MTGRKPRLVFYSDCVAFGGCENVLVNLMQDATIRTRYDVVFVYRKHRDYEEGRRRRIIGVPVIPVILLSNDSIFYRWSFRPMPRWVLRLIKLPLLIIEYAGCYTLFNTVVLLVVFSRLRPEVVHINNGGYPAAASCLVAAWCARVAGARRIVFTVNNIATRRRLPWDGVLDALVARCTDVFVTASREAQRALTGRRGIPAIKVRSIPNAIRPVTVSRDRSAVLREFGKSQKRFVLCEVGLLQYAKGQRFLVDAFRRLQHTHPDLMRDTVLFLVGDGEDRVVLEQAIHRGRLTDHIVLTGQRSDYADFIAAADLFVLPAVANEDMPLVVLAAMSLGTAIISTRIAGIPEQIRDTIEGILLDPMKLADELPAAIVRLLSDPEERKRLATAARRRHDALFTVDAVVRSYQALYSAETVFRDDSRALDGTL